MIGKEMQEQSKSMGAVLPEGIEFAELKMTRKPSGNVGFDWAPIERICEANGLDIALFREGPEDNLASLLAGWYHAHRTAGGQRDPVYEDLIGEVRAEDAAGQAFSLPPGRA